MRSATKACSFPGLKIETWGTRSSWIPTLRSPQRRRPVVGDPEAAKTRTRRGWGTRTSLVILAALLARAGCHSTPRDPRTVVFLIESSPTSLDPRVGTDAQSEHIDELLFDGLVARDAGFHFTPALAESWEQPDPLRLVL